MAVLYMLSPIKKNGQTSLFYSRHHTAMTAALQESEKTDGNRNSLSDRVNVHIRE